MSDIDVYDIPLSGMEKQLDDWAREAVELRHGVAGDPEGKLSTGTDETPAEAVQWLRRIRARSDRVDELLQAVKRARGRVRRIVAEAAFASTNEVDAGIRKQGRVEFTAAREKESNARLDAFETRRKEHMARRLLDVAEECVDVINQMNWSLADLRKDARSSIHALQFESHLER